MTHSRFDLVREGLQDEVGRSDKKAWHALEEIELSYTAVVAQRDRYRSAHARLEEQVSTAEEQERLAKEVIEGMKRTRDTILKRERQKQSELTRLKEQLETYEKALRLIQATPRLIDTHHIARAVLSNPADRSHEHEWSLPVNAGVYRCMMCGAETADLGAPLPVISLSSSPPEPGGTAPVAAASVTSGDMGGGHAADPVAQRELPGRGGDSSPASAPSLLSASSSAGAGNTPGGQGAEGSSPANRPFYKCTCPAGEQAAVQGEEHAVWCPASGSAS